MSTPSFITAFSGSSLEAELLAVHDIYKQANSALTEFINQAPSACPGGCGTCCEGFEPDILPAEANYLAAYLIHIGYNLTDRLSRFSDAQGCFLYDIHRPEAHCSIYEARPLICRMFAYSGVRNKKNEPVYRLCSKMPNAKFSAERSFSYEELKAHGHICPPVMGTFGSMVEGIHGGSGREPIKEALLHAYERLSMIRKYLGYAGTETHPDRPDNEPDTPIAS